ncbi:hypothetical protein AXX17_AT3G41410 [Arabidopsis thaliana]|uniref:Uncharacterized protein n=1 Tax=Arabidopsis thaliana TaxID=3702 RepID=A0A178VDM7_ARATH|nr:hypothetical protein AXX17_AT3G41410 [Arabidopsis thaliana]
MRWNLMIKRKIREKKKKFSHLSHILRRHRSLPLKELILMPLRQNQSTIVTGASPASITLKKIN